ncbi:MAG: redoxin domain-containing protein [bacterium]|nr:redoxin domain-containing protein [bacterium]
MKKSTLFIAVVIISTLAVPAIGQPERGIEVGQGIGPREMRTIEREKINVPDPEGLTVVVFWATWSPRSAKALELWQRFGARYDGHGVQVITVNADNQDMGPEDEIRIRDYLAGNSLSLPVIMDARLELFNEIGVVVFPTTMFFKPDGTLDYRYPGFPSSAELDLQEELESRLGIAKEPAEEGDIDRGKLAYQPKNNALLFYSMGRRVHEKGFPEKARAKYVEALQKDPEYADPLRALEGLFFADGRTPEAQEQLRSFLTASGLEGVIEKISQGETGQKAAPAYTSDAPAKAETEKEISPMERMRLLMEGKE